MNIESCRELKVLRISALCDHESPHHFLERKQNSHQKMGGYAIAEFAVILPMLVVIMLFGVWLISIATMNLRLHSGAVSAVRTLSLGKNLSEDFLRSLPKGTSVETAQDSTSVTVRLSTAMANEKLWVPIGIHLSATATTAREMESTDVASPAP